MDLYPFMKNCLREFNYPQIHSFNETEVADIFSPNNRSYLISWLIKLLDKEYEVVLENSVVKEELLGELIRDHGFCNDREKDKFMKGELPIIEQVHILYKIFKFLKDVSDLKKAPTKDCDVVTSDDIIALSNSNINLFPEYGQIKRLNPDEIVTKINDYKNEIEELKVLASTKPNCEDPINKDCIGRDFKNDLDEKLTKLRIDLPGVLSAIRNLKKTLADYPLEPYTLNPNFENVLAECNEKMHLVSQFVQDLNTIKNFETIKDWTNVHLDENATIYDMINDLRKETREVIDVSHYRCL